MCEQFLGRRALSKCQLLGLSGIGRAESRGWCQFNRVGKILGVGPNAATFWSGDLVLIRGALVADERNPVKMDYSERAGMCSMSRRDPGELASGLAGSRGHRVHQDLLCSA